MKKKPPAGATLIARLKEGRLKREQALVDKQNQRSGARVPAVRTADAIVEASDVKVVKNNKKNAVAEPIAAKSPGSSKSTPAKRSDFIHRQISIEDLRPVSDDYELLTEEIKLAGRFAAAGLIAQGLRLAMLKDDQIYKNHYGTFEDYCRAEHVMSATYAYRLIRIAEMAERLVEAEKRTDFAGALSDAMPDPFEVMLGLGHRHLLALLPLKAETAEELLLKGVPLVAEKGKSVQRIPIVKATEQQIREALQLLGLSEAEQRSRSSSKHAGPPRRSLEDIVALMEDWVNWLEHEADIDVIANKIGSGRDLTKLEQRLSKFSERLINCIEEQKKASR
jgi:hypothetical protein